MSIRYPTEDIRQLTQSDRHTNVFGQKAGTGTQAPAESPSGTKAMRPGLSEG